MWYADQIFWLVILAIVVSSISWTVTQEEIFREPRKWAHDRSESASGILERKFFYVWTCEYCFSHWVTLLILILTGFKLLFTDWRGYVLAFFALPWVANQFMSLYRRLRVDIKHENLKAEVVKHEKREKEREAKA
jgi:Na+-transporting methylmalonyl-CoA/oxaloacetate decarboxylase gamma subunit